MSVIVGFGFFLYKRFDGYQFELNYLIEHPVNVGYELGCCIVALAMILRWTFRNVLPRSSHFQINQISKHDIQREVKSDLNLTWDAKLLAKIPGNQSLHLWVEEKSIIHGCLPKAMQGIKIAHISDLHFTGKIDCRYYERMIRYSNQSNPDFVFVTGDIVDVDECIAWIPDVFSKAEGKLGKFYILGNHDKRIRSIERLHEAMADAGFQYAAPEWQTIETPKGKLLLAGNEIPWFNQARRLPKLSRERNDDEFRVLLSHSPDQLEFAAKRNIDMVFAGHVHGGQIRIPGIGPIVAPSRSGVKYASRPFFRIGNTMMHVSRGLSGDDPIRFHCAPELAMLTLNRAK